jgi:hypothetical protein
VHTAPDVIRSPSISSSRQRRPWNTVRLRIEVLLSWKLPFCHVIYACSRSKSTNGFETPGKVFNKLPLSPNPSSFQHLRSMNRSIKPMLFTLTPLNPRGRAVKFYTRRRVSFELKRRTHRLISDTGCSNWHYPSNVFEAYPAVVLCMHNKPTCIIGWQE